jgi:NTE family protein
MTSTMTRKKQHGRRKTWGLTLSGGTAFGIANGGVLAVLEREGLRPDSLSGSSMGAVIGALWASGHTAADMEAMVSRISLTNIVAARWPLWKGSLHAGLLRQRLTEHLTDALGDKTIGECDLPFICVAGKVHRPVEWLRIITEKDFTAHMLDCIQPYVFPPETRLLDAVLASTAIPVLFEPVRVGHDTFVDLVSFGAIPVQQLKDAHHPDVLVCTDTNQRYDGIAGILPHGWKKFIEDGERSIDGSRALCDLVIAPHLTGNQFRFDQARMFYDAGAAAAEDALPALRALLG